MKLQSNAQPVETIGVVSGKKAFTVKPTAKAFSVLSSKLYKNKIAAIVREISCNAHDAHVAAGCVDRPFEVHLPTALEPWFSVRDFGPGLSHTAVETIFTTFFESTKEDSNDYIGALGLGSKSPFSYVDSFAVYSHIDGTRRSYECFLEHGIPNLSLKAETPSNGESGLEISLVVQPEDFSSFASEAEAIYRWFAVRPTILGRDLAMREWVEPQGCGWAKSPMGNYHDSQSAIIMGQVRYPIDMHAIRGERWINNGMIFFFDIGELDIQAGREELSYDKATIAAINAKAAQAKAEIEASYAEMFRDCRNIIDAALVVRANPSRLHDVLTPHFGGAPVTRDHLTRLFDSMRRAEAFGNLPQKATADDITVVLMDVDTKTANKRWNIWRAANPTLNGFRVIITPGSEADYLARVGDMSYVLLSSVPLPARKAKMRVLGSTTMDIRHRTEVVVDLNEGGHYLLTRNLNVVSPTNEEEYLTAADFASLHLRLLATKTIKEPERIILVPWTRRRELGEGWTNAMTLLTDSYAERKKDAAFATMLADTAAFKEFEALMVGQGICFSSLERIGAHASDGHLTAFLALRKRCRDASFEGQGWSNLARIVDGDNEANDQRLCAQWRDLTTNFPLLIDSVKHRYHYQPVTNIVAKDIAMYVEAKEATLAV